MGTNKSNLIRILLLSIILFQIIKELFKYKFDLEGRILLRDINEYILYFTILILILQLSIKRFRSNYLNLFISLVCISLCFYLWEPVFPV